LHGADDGHLLVSPSLLRSADLSIDWQQELVLKGGEKISRLFLNEGRVYAFTDQNYFYCLSGDDGSIGSSKQLVRPSGTVGEFYPYKNQLYTIYNGSDLVSLDADIFIEGFKSGLKFNAVGRPVTNGSYFYIAGRDNRLHVLRGSDRVQLFEAMAPSEGAINNISVFEDTVLFATEAGDLVSMASLRPTERWNFKAELGNIGAVYRDGNYVYFASSDMNVYKINGYTGVLQWKRQMDGLPEGGPVVMSKVYQEVKGNGVAAVDKVSGQLDWQEKDAVSVLCEFGPKVYLMMVDGRIGVVDNRKGKIVDTVEAGGVDIWAVNTSDGRLYVGSERGKIVCISPSR
jgi:outer membrane protein assembly factor BamB